MALDHAAAIQAFRARLLTLSVATTGSTSLSATSTGYARAAGSFYTDGFEVGMEVTEVTGFSVAGNNQATTAQGRVITDLTATAMLCAGCATDAAAGSRVITAGLPFQRSWENVHFRPVVGFPYVEEDYIPGPSLMRSFPYNGGREEERGLYVVKYFGLSHKDVTAIYKTANAIKALFAAGTTLTAGSDTVRVVGRPAGPTVSQVTPLQSGSWAVCIVTVPWMVDSQNTVSP